MKSEIVGAAEEPLADNLNNLRASLDQGIRERLTDFRSPGIVRDTLFALVDDGAGVHEPVQDTRIGMGGSDFTILDSGSHTSVNVGNGIAYTNTGERIIISGNILTEAVYDATAPSLLDSGGIPIPQSTGRRFIPLAVGAATNYIWLDYLETVDVSKFFTDPDTGLKGYTRVTDGYQIIVNTTGIPTSGTALLLGSVVTDAFGAIVQADYDGSGTLQDADIRLRIYCAEQQRRVEITTPLEPAVAGDLPTDATPAYDFQDNLATGKVLNLQDHVKAVGHAILQPTNPHGIAIVDIPGLPEALVSQSEPQNTLYQKESTTNFIYSPLSTGSVTPSLELTVLTLPPRLRITRLSANDYLYLTGERFGSTTAVTPMDITSTFWELSGLTDATYNIFIQKLVVSNITYLAVQAVAVATPLPIDAYLLGTATVSGGGTVITLDTDTRTFAPTAFIDKGVDITQPLIPRIGQLYANDTLAIIERYNGSTWDSVGCNFVGGGVGDPLSTKLPFYMATAPTGWVALALNDKFLRVVSSGSTGGTCPITGTMSAVTNLSHTHTTSGTSDGGGNHGHTGTIGDQPLVLQGGGNCFDIRLAPGAGGITLSSAGSWATGVADHTHPINIASGGPSITMGIFAHADFVIAAKS